MNVKQEERPKRKFRIRVPNGRFKLTPKKSYEIRSIAKWLERSRESLKHCTIGKPTG